MVVRDQPLVGTSEGFGEQRRGIRREAVLDQLRDKRRKGAPAHIDHGGRFGIGQRRPVQIRRQLAGDIGAGHELHPARGVAPGQGNAGLRSGDTGRGDSGNDLVADASLAQRLQLLLEPAKNAGIARFQPHHTDASRGIVDQQAVDVVLLGRGPPCPLPDRDEIGAGPGQIEDRTGGEVVIEHDVGIAQPRGTFEREKLRDRRGRPR